MNNMNDEYWSSEKHNAMGNTGYCFKCKEDVTSHKSDTSTNMSNEAFDEKQFTKDAEAVKKTFDVKTFEEKIDDILEEFYRDELPDKACKSIIALAREEALKCVTDDEKNEPNVSPIIEYYNRIKMQRNELRTEIRAEIEKRFK